MQKLITLYFLNLLRLFCLISFLLVSVPTSFASETFSYSGRLVNTNGSPVPGRVNLTFDLAYSNQPGVILCTQDLNNVDLVNGVFHVRLDFGSCNLPNVLANISNGQTLSIRVTDRTPDPVRVYSFQSIHSVPQSIMSQMSKQLVQMSAAEGQVLTWNNTDRLWEPRTPAAPSGGTVTSVMGDQGLVSNTSAGSVTIGILDGGVTSTKILDGTIVDADISATADIAQSKIKNLATDLAAKESIIGTGASTDYLNGTKAWNNFDQSVQNALLIGYTSGTATPVAATDNVMEAIGKLEGQIIANDTAFDNAGQWDKDGTLLFYNSGNVGIGTATPSDKLEVVGDVSVSNKLRFKNSAISYVELRAPVGAGAVTLTLPAALGTNGQVLSTDSSGNLSWLTPSTDSSQITDGSIVDADISGTANIDQSKILGLIPALSGKEPTLANGVAGQYLAGGKVWATLNTDAVPEGATRLYFTEDKVLATDLLGLNTTAGSVTASDSILSAIGKTIGNITDLTTAQSDYLKKDGSVTMTGDLDAGGKAIINLLDPVSAQDAATKAYVDSAVISPAGNNKALQFNNAGSFGANDNLVWDNTNRRLGIDGSGFATAPLSPLHVHVNTNEALRVSHNGGYHWGLVPSGSTLSIKDLTNNLNRFTIGNTSGNYIEMNGTFKLTGSTSGFTGLASSAIGSNVTYTLPAADGTGGYVLSTNGSGALSWIAQPTSLAPSGAANGDLSGTYPNPTITALAATKISDGSIDNTEFGYLNGVSSNLQTQLDAKEASITAGTIDQYWAGTKSWRDFDADVRTALLSSYSVTAGVVANGDGIQTAISKLDGNIASLQANGQWSKNLTNVYYNSGNVGIGTMTPVGILHTSGTLPVFHNRYGAIASHIVLRSARGTSAAPTAVLAGEIIGTFSAEGYDGSGYSENAQLRILATENQSPTTKGSEFTFWTVPNGSTSSSMIRRMTIGNDGNVGIGTTTPTHKLHVNAASNGSPGGLFIDGKTRDVAENNIPLLQIDSGIAGGNSTALWVNTSGNLGIGTTSPTSKLHVSSPIGLQVTGINLTGDGTNNAALKVQDYSQWIWNTATNWGVFWAGSDNSAYSTFSTINPNEIAFVGNGAVRASVDLDDGKAYFAGNVGIGTTSPIAKLHLKGADGRDITVSPGTTSQSFNFIHNDNGNINARYANITGVLSNGGTGYNHGHLAFSTAPDTVGNPATVERMRVTGEGNVGIGTSTPRERLDLGGNGRAIFGPNTTWGANLIVGGNGWSGPDATVAATSGNLHLESRTGAYSTYINWYGATGGLRVGNGTSGGFGPVQASAFTVSSDVRLKKDITKLTNAISNLSKINGVTYKYKDEKYNQEQQIGVIAQEVQKVYPEAVLTDEEGMLSVNYASLVAPIIEAVKEQQKDIVKNIEMLKVMNGSIQAQDKGIKNNGRRIASLEAHNLQLGKQVKKLEEENLKLKLRLERIERLLTK